MESKMSLLGGVIDALGGQGGAMHNLEELAGHFGDGGLQNIVSKFEQGGMGDVVQSWIGSGGNLPVSADQLEQILGSEQVAKVAGALGIDTTHLADALPGLINHLTPNGQLPSGGITDILTQAVGSGGFGDLIGGFLKKA